MHLIDFLWIVGGHIVGGIAALHALMTKRDPRSAFGWIVVCLMLPILGAILYLLFGLNHIKSVAKQWQTKGLLTAQLQNLQYDHLDASVLSPELSARQAFQYLLKSGNNIFVNTMVAGNLLTPLYNGTEAYPEMIEAIDSAESVVYMQSYIFGTKGWGLRFIEALEAAHNRGVKVRVLIDGVGALYSFPNAIRLLRQRGVKAEAFLPLVRNYHTLHLNMRNHRKILVVDGSVGFTGGMNIHDDNFATGTKTPKVIDIHFKVQGPIIGVLQDTFLRDWYFSTKEAIDKIVYYDNTPKGSMLCRGISVGPHQDFSQLQTMLCAAFSSAQTHIRIQSPYFLLGYSLSAAAISAVLRGVKVEVVLPESNNLSFVKGASESTFLQLIQHGIEIYYHPGDFDHSKIFIVDDFCVFLGSANLDIRSRLLNFEFNLEVHDQKLAQKMISHFEQLKQNSRLVTQNWLQSRSFGVKLHNALFKLFSLYL